MTKRWGDGPQLHERKGKERVLCVRHRFYNTRLASEAAATAGSCKAIDMLNPPSRKALPKVNVEGEVRACNQ